MAQQKLCTEEKSEFPIKLYTEEQVKEMIDDAHNGIDGYYDIFKKHTPIELPTDEEIWHESNKDENLSKGYAFARGAEWMRNKILNQ